MVRVAIVLLESEIRKAAGGRVDEVSEETARTIFLKGDKTSAVSAD
jgi:hypothetical protein